MKKLICCFFATGLSRYSCSKKIYMIERIRRYSAFILLAVFVEQFVGSMLFTHTHSYGDLVVTHSHLYNVFSHHQHHHSEKALFIIHHLSHAVFTVPLTFLVSIPPITILSLSKPRRIPCLGSGTHRHLSIRAPPIVVFCLKQNLFIKKL